MLQGNNILEVALPKLGLDEKQADALTKLLQLTIDGFDQSIQSLNSPSVALEYIKDVTQAAWLRKSGTERWDIEDITSQREKRRHFFVLFDRLNLLSLRKPKVKYYNGALLLGALQARVEARLDYLISLCKQQALCFGKLYLLGGERPLLKERESITYRLKEGATELDMMVAIFEDRRLTCPKELSGIEMLRVNARMNNSGKRPTLADTVNVWLKEFPRPAYVLAVSNQPYVDYQHDTIVNLLPKGFELETVGCEANPEEKVGVILDTLARGLYQRYLQWEREDNVR